MSIFNQLKNQISNPSDETLALWRLQDSHKEMLERINDDEDDFIDIKIESDVK